MHRYSLSTSFGAQLAPFSARSFLVHGEHLRQLRGGGPPRDSYSGTRQVLTFRGSPSPANYACLFLPPPLPLPLFILLLLASWSSSSSPTSLSPRLISSTSSVQLLCLFAGFSLASSSRYHPATLPFLHPSPPSIDRLRSPASCCPRANFLHSSERFSTLHLSFSIIEKRCLW